MSSTKVLFFGINDVGMRIYEWLCTREDTQVQALVTTKEQANLAKKLQPDVIVSVGYDHLIPEEILSIPKKGAINLHPSLLPHNKGKSPNVWSIVKDTPAGATLHFMTEKFDEGDIIAQKKVEKKFSDTGKSLHHKLEEAQYSLFKGTWQEFLSGEIERESQRDGGEYHSIEDFKELCKLDPEEEYKVEDLINILRALTFPPFENAHIEKGGEKYYIDLDVRKESAEDKKEGMIESY
jgi:methionyl-tRNA formyltransferase